MSSSTYGAIKLATAEDVGAVLKKKMGTQTGYKPKEFRNFDDLPAGGLAFKGQPPR